MFWADKKFEPKRTFRWKVQFTLSESRIPSHFIKNVKKPSFTVNSKRVQGLGYAINVAQQIQYNPVEITFIDDKENTVTNWIYKFFSNSGILFNGNQGAQTCINTNLAKTNAEDIEIQMIDEFGSNLEIWGLHNAWISSFSQSDLNYESNDLSTYTMTITYDWFSYKQVEKTNEQEDITSPQNAEESPKTKKPRPGSSAIEFPELFPPGPLPKDAFESTSIGTNEYRSTVERGKQGATARELGASANVRNENYTLDSSGRRILQTDTT